MQMAGKNIEMGLPKLLSRLAIWLFIACGVGHGGAGEVEKPAPKAQPDGAPKTAIETREASEKNEAARLDEETAGATQETKRAERTEKDQHDALLILLLQILRSSR